MLVKTGSVMYLGAKKNMQKKGSDRVFSIYTIFDEDSAEAVRLFAQDDTIDSFVNPRDMVTCLIEMRGNFLTLKQMIPAQVNENE